MNDENPSPSQASTGDRLLSGIFSLARIFVRFILIVLLIGLLALLLFGIPYAYYRFVTPALNEVKYVASAQVEQEQLSQRLLDDLQGLQQRADTLETRLDSERQRFGEIDQAIEDLEATQLAQMDEFMETQTAIDENVRSINTDIDSLDSRLAELSTALDQYAANVAAVDEKSQELETRLLSEDEPINRLYRDIVVLKAMELLTRSRLLIYQSDFGLAQDDLESARELLSGLELPQAQAELQAEVVERIDQVLENLPDAPELATGDLEIAWQLLNDGLFSSSAPAPAVSSTPAPVSASSTPSTPAPAAITATATP